MTTAYTPRRGTIRARVLELIDSPAGATLAGMAKAVDRPSHDVQTHTAFLMARGLAHRATAHGQLRPFHYFRHLAHAQAFAAEPPQAPVVAQPQDAPKLVDIGEVVPTADGKQHLQQRKHSWPLSLPNTPHRPIPSERRGAPKDGADVVPQYGLSRGYDERYQCAPGEIPYGAGFAAAGIGRDVTTGRPWGATNA